MGESPLDCVAVGWVGACHILFLLLFSLCPWGSWAAGTPTNVLPCSP